MATATDPSDPAHMTQEERLTEVASILAKGILRLHRRMVNSGDITATQDSSEFQRNCLDDGAEKRLHGPTWLTAHERPRQE